MSRSEGPRPAGRARANSVSLGVAVVVGAVALSCLAAGEGESPRVQVITDARQLANARRLATQPAEAELLGRLEEAEFWDWQAVSRLRVRKSAVLPRLLEIARGRGGRRRREARR